MFLGANGLEQAQNAFVMSGNTCLSLSIGQKRGLDDAGMSKLKEELIERLVTAARHEEAGDLIDPVADFEGALDCYLKGSAYQKAIKLCMQVPEKLPLIQSQVK